MKYKSLTTEELQELEPEFIKYLASNSITADDWVHMKKHEPQKTSDMISHFSELIFENILNNIEYLELRSPKKIIVFKCGMDKLESLIMETDNKEADFLNPEYFKKAMDSPEGITVSSAEKEYEIERNIELFNMTEKGCFPTDSKFYDILSTALNS